MRLILITVALVVLTACESQSTASPDSQTDTNDESAYEFVARIQQEQLAMSEEIWAAYWVRQNFITKDTAVLAAKAGERSLEFESRMVEQAKRFKGTEMDTDTARAIELMLRGSAAPAPDDPEKRAELAAILTDMEGQYGAGEYCSEVDGKQVCRQLQELEAVLAKSRDYDELLDVWQGWRTVSPAYKPQYQRFVQLANEGAATFGFDNLGDLWKAGYDMPTEAFTIEARRLWEQVKPFYEELHCHVRAKLAEEYGEQRVPLDGPIPAHLLGNMWSQTWDNIYPLLEPFEGVASLDVTAALKEQGYDEEQMTRMAETFFTSDRKSVV